MTDGWRPIEEAPDDIVLPREVVEAAAEALKELGEYAQETIADLCGALARKGNSFTAWRSIETAPRDGTDLLILGDGQAVQGRYCAQDHVWENGRFGLGFGGEHGADPTHWMPLPQPPQESKS